VRKHMNRIYAGIIMSIGCAIVISDIYVGYRIYNALYTHHPKIIGFILWFLFVCFIIYCIGYLIEKGDSKLCDYIRKLYSEKEIKQ